MNTQFAILIIGLLTIMGYLFYFFINKYKEDIEFKKKIDEKIKHYFPQSEKKKEPFETKKKSSSTFRIIPYINPYINIKKTIMAIVTVVIMLYTSSTIIVALCSSLNILNYQNTSNLAFTCTDGTGTMFSSIVGIMGIAYVASTFIRIRF